MLKFVIAYMVILVVIGIYDFFKVKTFEDYALAGKKQEYPAVFMSLMATMIGASATIGVVDRVSNIGFPAFWWLGVGALGMILQSVLLSEKVRVLNANTLPDIAMKTIGKEGKFVIALIIAIAWTGIIAAQFVAMAQIIILVTGNNNITILLTVIAIVVILYTLIGGQLSVIKTDIIQFIIMTIGFMSTFIYLFSLKDSSVPIVLDNIELLNNKFDMMDLINLAFIVGGTYFLGPDILSRNLVSKNGKTAKRAALHTGISLIFFSLIITLIGLWTNINIDDLDGQNPLIYLIVNYIPFPIGVLLTIGLISTLLSSVDTCLINVASIIEHDLLKRKEVNEMRIIVAIIGIVSVIIAVFKNDIISLLTGAYSIYAPGVVFPLFVAIWFNKKIEINKSLWFTGVFSGSILGILSSYFSIGFEYLPLVGMGCSLIFSILSIAKGVKLV